MVLQHHYGWWVGVPATAVAGYVATARVHDNKHYLSDVIFGAGVGYVVGHTVTRHGKGNFTEFAMYPMAVPRGVGIAFVRTAHEPEKRGCFGCTQPSE
jgi:hypothetical protein